MSSRSRSRSRSPARAAASSDSHRERDAPEETSKLHVANLSWNTDAESLKHAFGKFGEVTDAFVASDRETGRSRGFGFVTFADRKDAEDAKKSLHDSDLDGRQVRVEFAAPKSDNGGRRGGFGGGDRRGGGFGGRGGGRGGYGGDRDRRGGGGGYGGGRDRDSGRSYGGGDRRDRNRDY